MFSDGHITVNNLDGSFFIEGSNSKLISDDIKKRYNIKRIIQ